MYHGNSVRSRIIVIVISLLILGGSVLLNSCAEQSSQDIAESLPYVFHGIMQVDMENAPPVEVFLDTNLPAIPDKVPVYIIQAVDEKYIQALASRLGFNDDGSQPTNADDPYVFYRDSASGNRVRLEVYQDGRISA